MLTNYHFKGNAVPPTDIRSSWRYNMYTTLVTLNTILIKNFFTNLCTIVLRSYFLDYILYCGCTHSLVNKPKMCMHVNNNAFFHRKLL